MQEGSVASGRSIVEVDACSFVDGGQFPVTCFNEGKLTIRSSKIEQTSTDNPLFGVGNKGKLIVQDVTCKWQGDIDYEAWFDDAGLVDIQNLVLNGMNLPDYQKNE
jgi:hypothetical protein